MLNGEFGYVFLIVFNLLNEHIKVVDTSPMLNNCVCLQIQEIVSEILEFIKKQGSSVTLDKPLINILIDSYSNDYVKNITDKKYGDGDD